MSVEAESAQQALMSKERQGGCVAVSEDPFVSSYLRTILSRHGYQVIVKEAHHLIDRIHRGEFPCRLVITNDPKPFLVVGDQVAVLYIAATPDFELAARFRNCSVLRKPFRPSDLMEAIRHLESSL